MTVALTPAQAKWLNWLRENGGEATIDRYGRLIARGEVSNIGAHPAWIGLLAKGWLQGGGGRIVVTMPKASA